MQLLREYAAHGNEDAFTILVSRHVAMVFHTALRQTHQFQLAEEITQTVFTLLARKASGISAKTLLSGWLFNTVRFVSLRALRDELRRRAREFTVAAMSTDIPPQDPARPAEQALPFLDEMLARLPSRDREALLARYFDGKSFLQVGSTLGGTEEGARKRVQRALEKMRVMLAARGIVSNGAALATTLESLGAQAAPTSLSATAVSSAALKAASGTVAFSALTQSALEIMKWTRVKVVGAVALAVVFGTATISYSLRHTGRGAALLTHPPAAPSGDSREALQETADRLRAENAQLSALLVAANARKAQLLAANQAALRLVSESKEITRQNLAPTNNPAAMRDAFVSIGRLMLLDSLSKTNPTAQDRQAIEEATSQETLRFMKAAGQFDLFHMDEYSPASPEEGADLMTQTLHGIVQLSPQQFKDIKEALTKYEAQVLQQAPEHKLHLPDSEEWMSQVEHLLSEPQRQLVGRILQADSPAQSAQPAANAHKQ
jgi:RNA polymerase sigma factor (sigma-70 family)